MRGVKCEEYEAQRKTKSKKQLGANQSSWLTDRQQVWPAL